MYVGSFFGLVIHGEITFVVKLQQNIVYADLFFRFHVAKSISWPSTLNHINQLQTL
jgi:hypothetical protein